MNKRFLPYFILPRYRHWAVYKRDAIHNKSATKVASFLTKEDAQAEAYRLNGIYMSESAKLKYLTK